MSTKYLAAYEYDAGDGSGGGAAPIYYGGNVLLAVTLSVDDLYSTCDLYATDADASWYRVDVWAIEDGPTDESSAWDMWRDAELPADGDVFHAYVSGGRDG